MKVLTSDRWYENVLLGQGPRTPHGAITDKNWAMGECRLAGEDRSSEENCCSAISSTTNPTSSHPGLTAEIIKLLIYLTILWMYRPICVDPPKLPHHLQHCLVLQPRNWHTEVLQCKTNIEFDGARVKGYKTKYYNWITIADSGLILHTTGNLAKLAVKQP
jgi:hypothetical protein